MSKPSFEIINYSIRPGKAVERKMIASLLSKLSAIHPIQNYRYIGFGSTYFHDFILFHKELGINDLISIEVEEALEDRFLFNKPFKCIDLKMGHSTDILPTLSWDKKTILWLDYDSKLSSGVFSDISTFCTNGKSGNLIMITVNCHSNSYGKSPEKRKSNLEEELGRDNIPYTLKFRDFSNEKISYSLKYIIETYINSNLMQVNTGFPENEKLTYVPLIKFKYKDGATMITVGGVILNPENRKTFDLVKFDELGFPSSTEEFFSIKVPSITPKEMKFINSQLPSGVDEHGNFTDKDIIQNHRPKIPSGDVHNYTRIYRFLPIFTENFSF